MRLIGVSIGHTRAQARWIGLAGALALLAVVGAGSGMGAGPAATLAPATPTPTATPLPTLLPRATPTPTPTPYPTPTLAEPPAADIDAAIMTQGSWIPYRSTAYKFAVWYPADWVVSETQTPGWVIFSGWDGSNLSTTWRAVTPGTTLNVVTNEVWAAMKDAGFIVDGYDGGTIEGLPSIVLTVDGRTTTGQARHGIIGLVVTDTGRYRIEVWSRPGTEKEDVALYKAFARYFAFRS
jgi:hypothetical protein